MYLHNSLSDFNRLTKAVILLFHSSLYNVNSNSLSLRQSGRIEIFLSPIIASEQTDPCICMLVHVHKHCKTQNTWQVSEWVLDNVAPKTLPTTSGLQTWLHKQPPPIYPTCISTTVTVCSGRGELPVRVRRWCWWRWSCLQGRSRRSGIMNSG